MQGSNIDSYLWDQKNIIIIKYCFHNLIEFFPNAN